MGALHRRHDCRLRATIGRPTRGARAGCSSASLLGAAGRSAQRRDSYIPIAQRVSRASPAIRRVVGRSADLADRRRADRVGHRPALGQRQPAARRARADRRPGWRRPRRLSRRALWHDAFVQALAYMLIGIGITLGVTLAPVLLERRRAAVHQQRRSAGAEQVRIAAPGVGASGRRSAGHRQPERRHRMTMYGAGRPGLYSGRDGRPAPRAAVREEASGSSCSSIRTTPGRTASRGAAAGRRRERDRHARIAQRRRSDRRPDAAPLHHEAEAAVVRRPCRRRGRLDEDPRRGALALVAGLLIRSARRARGSKWSASRALSTAAMRAVLPYRGRMPWTRSGSPRPSTDNAAFTVSHERRAGLQGDPKRRFLRTVRERSARREPPAGRRRNHVVLLRYERQHEERAALARRHRIHAPRSGSSNACSRRFQDGVDQWRSPPSTAPRVRRADRGRARSRRRKEACAAQLAALAPRPQGNTALYQCGARSAEHAPSAFTVQGAQVSLDGLHRRQERRQQAWRRPGPARARTVSQRVKPRPRVSRVHDLRRSDSAPPDATSTS